MSPKVCAFCGIDGVGKTTIVNELSRRLSINGKVQIIWFRWKAFLSYILYFYSRVRGLTIKKLNIRTGTYDKIHMWYKDPLLRKFYAWLLIFDMILYYTFTMLRAKIRHVDILIFDRFFLDALVDIIYETNNFKTLTSFVAKLVYIIIGGSGPCIILDIDPLIAFSRKKDILSTSELSIKRKMYTILAKCLNLPIITNYNIDETMQKIVKLLW